MGKPLDGLLVLELGTHVAVPKASRMMADWGAKVIKIEPLEGEQMRIIGRSFDLPIDPDYNPIFQTENLNKLSLSLNMKEPEGAKIMHKLLENADVFMTNVRPKPLEKFGLSYEQIKDKYPRLIYGYFSGYGDKGPEKDRPGFDLAAFWAKSGMTIEWMNLGESPVRPTGGTGDGPSGSNFLSGVLAALYAREKTGKGAKITVSLYSSALWYNTLGVLRGQEQFGNKYPKARNDVSTPTTPLFQTKDGEWILISMPNYEQKYKLFLDVLKIPQYKTDSRFMTFAEAVKHKKELIAIFDEAFANISTDEALKGLAEADIVHQKLINPNDICKDEQAWANGYLKEITMECGKNLVLPTVPIQFEPDEFDEAGWELAPQLGADTEKILKDLGYSDSEIKKLEETKVVKQFIRNVN